MSPKQTELDGRLSSEIYCDSFQAKKEEFKFRNLRGNQEEWSRLRYFLRQN
jgi:hypothetical protein